MFLHCLGERGEEAHDDSILPHHFLSKQMARFWGITSVDGFKHRGSAW